MTEKKLTDEELKQVSGGADERDELRVNSNLMGEGGIIDIEFGDSCHFNPSRFVIREGVTLSFNDCKSCKYNQHPTWLKSTCNANVEQ